MAQGKLANKLLADPALGASELQAGLPPQAQQGPGQGMADPEAIHEALTQTAMAAGAMREVLSKKTVSRKDIFRLTSDLMNAGVITAPQAAKELSTLPASDEQLKPWLFMRWAQADQTLDDLMEVMAQSGAPEQMPPPMAEEPMPGTGMPPGPPNRMLG